MLGYTPVSRAGRCVALQPDAHRGIWGCLQPKSEEGVLAVWVKGASKPPRGHNSTQECHVFTGLSTWID